jgi:hypothetical protein
MYPAIETSLDIAMQALRINDSPRKAELERLSSYLAAKRAAGQSAKVTVVCTHNSRRSHLGQFWLAVAAAQFAVDLETFSGGTEATACHPNTLAALERAGAQVTALTPMPNPHYTVSYAEDASIEAWSKRYDDAANPQTGFAALMVCGEADEACPYIPGAEVRISLPYKDPKYADGTRSRPIVFLCALVKHMLHQV